MLTSCIINHEGALLTNSSSRFSEAMAYKSELDGAAEACLCGRHYGNLETVGQRDSR